MVQNTGKTLRPGTIKPVNLPELVDVQESGSGDPAAVTNPRRQIIIAIEDRWRIDDEWWRSESVSRLYYAALFTSGQRVIIYKDLNNGQWYKQNY